MFLAHQLQAFASLGHGPEGCPFPPTPLPPLGESLCIRDGSTAKPSVAH